MVYVIGVSSGIFSAAAPEERLQYTGLYKKAQYCITKGVQFVQIDLESISEFGEPELKENMKKIEGLGVTFGIHSETQAFGVEVAELDSAIETDYKFGHKRLFDVITKSAEIKSKYVLIHSSESQPFLFLERHMQPAALVDFHGRPLKEFLEEDKNKYLIDWLMGGEIDDLTQKIFLVWQEKRKEITAKDIENIMPSKDFIWIEILGNSLTEIMRRHIDSLITEHETRSAGRKYESFDQQEKDFIDGQLRSSINSTLKEYRNYFLNQIRSRHLAYGPERFAYWFIAKWMEDRNEPLWVKIVNETIKYFAKTEKKEIDQWLAEKGIKKLSVDDEGFRQYNYLWVPAVSAKYMWGHLNIPEEQEKFFPDIKKILKEKKIPLVLETPMAHRGVEEWLRLPNPIQIYYLAKEVGEDVIQIAMDFEHMISIRLEPENVIEALPEDGGKLVRVIHAGWPAPLAPAHIPIPLGSEQHVYLYKMLFKLRQKGFGKDEKDYYIVFERGGGADPVQQSIIALRKIVENLVKDTDPNKLPLEFYGVGTGELASEERQERAMHEHAHDPLKGLLAIPEEEYSFLSTAAVGKPGGAEKWKKEELR